MRRPLKEAILTALERHPVDSVVELEPHCNSDAHSIQHVLWALRKQGLVSFRETYVGRNRRLTRIQLTKRTKSR